LQILVRVNATDRSDLALVSSMVGASEIDIVRALTKLTSCTITLLQSWSVSKLSIGVVQDVVSRFTRNGVHIT
jgi:hypothetical protein